MTSSQYHYISYSSKNTQSIIYRVTKFLSSLKGWTSQIVKWTYILYYLNYSHHRIYISEAEIMVTRFHQIREAILTTKLTIEIHPYNSVYLELSWCHNLCLKQNGINICTHAQIYVCVFIWRGLLGWLIWSEVEQLQWPSAESNVEESIK